MAGTARLVGPAAGRLGLVLRVSAAGERGRRQCARPDHGGQHRDGAVHPHRRHPDRHLLGDAPQHSSATHAATFIGYIGLATPSFLLALVLLFYLNRWFGISIGGMMDPRYARTSPGRWPSSAPSSPHLIVPGRRHRARRHGRHDPPHARQPARRAATSSTPSPPRPRGCRRRRALLKYPFRIALNPFVADIGNLLPSIVSGSVLVSLVLSLPTVGPILLQALKNQDQYLAGFILMFVARAHRDRHADRGPAAGRRSTRASASEKRG